MLKKRGTGRGRGRPRGSGRRGNGRGRGGVLSAAAAELAGAQASKTAAFAAYGYSLTGAKSSRFITFYLSIIFCCNCICLPVQNFLGGRGGA